MTVYCISGLGADHRAFERLQWAPNLRIVHLPWLEPSPNESLQAYAHRMPKPIQSHEPFALVGLSFGGILAIEMLHFLQPNKTIIISSISNNTQLPWYFRVVGKTKLYKSKFPICTAKEFIQIYRDSREVNLQSLICNSF